ncbi:MAG TPA: NAD(P)-dependent oxidoreductase [Rhodocyclaceae bacterium]|jgi:UDP-glucose 4-epimerase
MPTIVITGASGFVGRQLHAHLVAMGAHVIAVSRQPRTGMVQVDDYGRSPDGDVLIHLGEESDRAVVNRAGEAYLDVSTRVVGALAARGYRRLVYISSGTVYGDASPEPNEPGNAVIANDIYNRAKLANEDIVLAAGGGVARLSNLYGEGMAVSNVLSDIIAQVPGPGPLVVRDVTPVRDYLHVSDAAEALARFAESNYMGIINVATGRGTSVHRLAEIALAAAGQAGREVMSTNSMTRSSINVLDIKLTSVILDWWPRMDLAERLTELVHSKMGSNYGR